VFLELRYGGKLVYHGIGNLIIHICSFNGLFCARILVAVFMHCQCNVIFSMEIDRRVLNRWGSLVKVLI
jgi:hypothetical protein